MADNFNLRTFLSENKLTKNAKLLKEEASFNGKPVNTRSIEIEGIDTDDYPDFVDAYITYAEYEDGTPLTDQELHDFQAENYEIVGELIHDRQLYLEAKKQASSGDMAYTKKVEETLEESKLTTKERRLVEMVQDALGVAPQAVAEEVPMSEEEMVDEQPLPKYENIEKLMQEIEAGTNEAAHSYKMKRMKEIAEMLEKKCSALEEGEGADFVDAKKVKQMKKDIMTLRKHAEKLEKEYDKKFAKKQAVKESRITNNLRMLNEGEEWLDGNWNSDNYKDLIKKVENTFSTGGRGNSFTYNGKDFTISKRGERYIITSGTDWRFEALSVESAIKQAHTFANKREGVKESKLINKQTIYKMKNFDLKSQILDNDLIRNLERG
jgi:hypothetical protein